MRGRTIDVFDSHRTSKMTPGPGAYESIQLEPNSGRFMCSKFSDSKFGKITDLGDRFSKEKMGPGPGSYREGDSLSPSGKYLLSSHRGRGSRTFNRAVRKHLID